jgi:hypothetical protein
MFCSRLDDAQSYAMRNERTAMRVLDRFDLVVDLQVPSLLDPCPVESALLDGTLGRELDALDVLTRPHPPGYTVVKTDVLLAKRLFASNLRSRVADTSSAFERATAIFEAQTRCDLLIREHLAAIWTRARCLGARSYWAFGDGLLIVSPDPEIGAAVGPVLRRSSLVSAAGSSAGRGCYAIADSLLEAERALAVARVLTKTERFPAVVPFERLSRLRLRESVLNAVDNDEVCLAPSTVRDARSDLVSVFGAAAVGRLARPQRWV